MHRDLKPENIMMDPEEVDGSQRIYLVDFGTGMFFNKGELKKEVAGTPYYIAPEVVNKSYNEKCDIWSVGVIIYILLTGLPPFGYGQM